MTPRDTTHRLHEEGSLCGLAGNTLTPYESRVNCPTCLALMEMAERRRRALVRRRVIVIAKFADA